MEVNLLSVCIFIILILLSYIFLLHANIYNKQWVKDVRNTSNKNSDLGYWEWNPQTNKGYFSPTYYTMLEYKPNEFKPGLDEFISVIHKDDREMVIKFLNNYINSYENKNYLIEFRAVSKSGAIKWIQALARVTKRNNHGEPTLMVGYHIDITDIKTIQRERTRFFDLSLDMMTISNFEGFFIDFNNSWTTTLGWTKDELRSKKWIELVHHDDINTTIDSFQQLLSGECVSSFTNRYITKSGDYRWLLWSSYPVLEQQKIYSVVRDITTIKENEQRIKESEERYKSLFNTMFSGYALHEIICDDSGKPINYKFLNVNPSFERMTGLKKEDIINKTVKDVLPETEDYWIKKFGEVATTGVPARFENYSKDLGKYYDVYAHSPSYGKFAATFVDVSDKIIFEEKLLRTRAYLADILDSMPSMIIGLNKEGFITLWNRQIENTTGIKADYAMNKNIDEVIVQFSFLKKMTSLAEKNKEIKKKEAVQISINGSDYYFNFTIFPIISDQTDGAVVRIDDTTDYLKLQETLIQSEKMISIGILSAGMAHEINNPLAIITQGIQNTLRRISPDIENNIKAALSCGTTIESINCYMKNRNIISYLEGINEAANRSNFIVKNMLNYSRKSATDKTVFSITNIIENSIKILLADYNVNNKYDFRHINIIKHYNAIQSELFLIGNEIEQVFINVLKNAAQAIFDKTKSIPTDAVIEITTLNDNNFIIIKIKDNGIGMSENLKKRIFDPFFTTKGVGEGTGLGMPVVYSIIKNNHNGDIIVESVEGEGTEVIIRLPIEIPHAKSGED